VTALRRLLSGIVDYAGLFPPAALDLAAAVRNYAEYRASSDAWMLGRFIIDVGRLDEFSAVLHERSDSGEWRLSALAGPEFEADVARCVAFNAANAGRASVDTLETKLASPAAIACAAGATAGGFTLFVEVPIDRDPILLIQAIADARMNAKVRMGGVTAEAFPAASDVVRFMRRCGDAGVPFKATAGLHHPLRAKYRLTYASDAPRGEMYGYLNVFLAAPMPSRCSRSVIPRRSSCAATRCAGAATRLDARRSKPRGGERHCRSDRAPFASRWTKYTRCRFLSPHDRRHARSGAALVGGIGQRAGYRFPNPESAARRFSLSRIA
jgi:hypothetical protein